jgi:hypothetical protein
VNIRISASGFTCALAPIHLFATIQAVAIPITVNTSQMKRSHSQTASTSAVGAVSDPMERILALILSEPNVVKLPAKEMLYHVDFSRDSARLNQFKLQSSSITPSMFQNFPMVPELKKQPLVLSVCVSILFTFRAHLFKSNYGRISSRRSTCME